MIKLLTATFAVLITAALAGGDLNVHNDDNMSVIVRESSMSESRIQRFYAMTLAKLMKPQMERYDIRKIYPLTYRGQIRVDFNLDLDYDGNWVSQEAKDKHYERMRELQDHIKTLDWVLAVVPHNGPNVYGIHAAKSEVDAFKSQQAALFKESSRFASFPTDEDTKAKLKQEVRRERKRREKEHAELKNSYERMHEDDAVHERMAHRRAKIDQKMARKKGEDL